jgi:hypothetical protein
LVVELGAPTWVTECASILHLFGDVECWHLL